MISHSTCHLCALLVILVVVSAPTPATSVRIIIMALNPSHLSSDSSPVIVAGHKFPPPVTSRSTTIECKLSGSTPSAYERDRLIRRCVGREVHVVNLMSLMPAWPTEIHSQDIFDEIDADIDQWLKRQVEFIPSPSSNPGWTTSPPSWGLQRVVQ